MTITKLIAAVFALMLVINLACGDDETAFTYQGRLLDGGAPANGLFDFRFGLFATESGGIAVAAVQADGVQVTDGLFTVEIDFGADAFDNTQRWLEIVVGQTTLTPRQPITRAPYAIQTRGMFVGDNGNVLFHSLNEVEGTVTFSSIGGIDMILDADANNVGEDQNARIVMMQDGGQVAGRMGYREGTNQLEIMQEYDSDLILGTNNQDRLTILNDGNVGIGTTLPDYHLHVVGSGLRAIFGHSTASSGGTGVYGRSDTNLGEGVSGIATAPSGQNSGVRGVSQSTDGMGVSGIATALSGQAYGVRGDSDSSSGAGVYGYATASVGFASGVEGVSDSGSGKGVFGYATASSGITRGVLGSCASTEGTGVEGFAGANSGDTNGVYGRSQSTSGTGVFGYAAPLSGVNYGVKGKTNSSNGYDFYADGAGMDWGSSSSIRWKSNIRNIDQPLEKVARLRGVYFDWDAEHGGHHDVGMIAEEVGKILPEIVTYEENGIDADGMDYSKLTPLLVEAVNALRTEKDAEITSLRAENDVLRERLDMLEQIVKQQTPSRQLEESK